MVMGMDPRVHDIRLARDGVIGYDNYSRHGYARLVRGVYGRVLSEDSPDPFQRRRQQFILQARGWMAAYASKGAVLYGPSALQVMGVALPESVEDWENCHILIPPGVSRPQQQRLIAHRCPTDPEVRHQVAGFPLLDPVEHWTQLRDASLDALVEVGDGLVRRSNPWTTMDHIESTLDRLRGRHGVRQARRASRHVRPGTDSLYETRTRLLVVRAGLPEPVVNCLVYCPASGRTFHLDMGYPNEKVGLEFDGAVHVGNRRQMDIDANRRRLLQDAGWMIITITAAQLMDPASIVRSVESALILRRAMAGSTRQLLIGAGRL